MKFLDTLKLSLHSIFHNKIRSLITVLIVFVVSLLIMVICIIGISFYTSVSNAFIKMYNKTGTSFRMESYRYEQKDGENYMWRGISYEEYSAMIAQFNEYPELVDNMSVSGGYMDTFFLYDLEEEPTSTELKELWDNGAMWNKYDTSRSNTQIISSWGDLDTYSQGISYVKDGRLWNRDDEGSKYIWVSESFISLAASCGEYLEVGDEVVIAFMTNVYSSEQDTWVNKLNADEFTIKGIFLNSALTELRCSSEIFLDVVTAYNLMGEDFSVDNISIVNEPRIGYIFEDEYKKMSDIVKAVNEQVEPSEVRGREDDRFTCDLVENLKNTRIIGFVMIGAAVFICFIILVISIGSVANSVVISVDKNKRFLGVMMAVGLNKGGVKRIVQYEALVIIMIATGVAYGILRFVQQYFQPIVDTLMSMPGLTEKGIIVMPLYVPVITVFAFIAMALLFARKSLSSIINMDVISVISEVS